MAKSTVYFTNELTPEAVVKMYRQLGIELPGKVAVKVHSGEDGNQNYLHPEFMKPVINAVNGTVVECNTAYGGARNETPKHIELMKKHHWSDLFDVDIMDAEGPDVEWPIENGKVLVLADKPEVFRCGLRYGRLRFTTETAEECAAILRAHNAGTITADADTTRGLFYRGVE